jgi:hypothetical protein|tara:strand:+ start:2578 stop:2835 length:258 start_codon:yes stop_codon:yes gene_type:complete
MASVVNSKSSDDDTLFALSAQAMVDFLKNDRFQQRLVKQLNSNIDIPFINESTEASIIQAICTTVVSALEESLSEDDKAVVRTVQ